MSIHFCPLTPIDHHQMHVFVILFLFWLCRVFIVVLRLSLVAMSRGCSLVTGHQLLIVVASLVAKHGL